MPLLSSAVYVFCPPRPLVPRNNSLILDPSLPSIEVTWSLTFTQTIHAVLCSALEAHPRRSKPAPDLSDPSDVKHFLIQRYSYNTCFWRRRLFPPYLFWSAFPQTDLPDADLMDRTHLALSLNRFTINSVSKLLFGLLIPDLSPDSYTFPGKPYNKTRFTYNIDIDVNHGTDPHLANVNMAPH
jgi:hypothetical protein